MDSNERNEIDGLLMLDDVAKLTTFCKNSVRNRWQDGTFPAPVRLGRRIAWRRSDVARWIDALPAADFAQRSDA